MKAKVVSLIAVLFFSYQHYLIMETNIPGDDYESFMPVKYKNGIFFSSKKENEVLYNLFYSEIDEKENLYEPIAIKIESKFLHLTPAPGEFIEESGEFYFTASNVSSSSDVKSLAIFKSKIIDWQLQEVELLNICRIKFDYMCPTFSRNGLTMILSSNKDGEFNLYEYKRFNYQADWELVRKLNEINPKLFASYPKLVNDSTLIFSSYGEELTEDLNLYESNFNYETKIWGIPRYMDELNSNYDDLGITFINSESGYFSSKRTGQDKLYYFEKSP